MCKVENRTAAVPLCSLKILQMTDVWHCIVQQNATLPADALRSLALQQWVQCDVLLEATRNELCAGQQLEGGPLARTSVCKAGAHCYSDFWATLQLLMLSKMAPPTFSSVLRHAPSSRS